MYQRVGVFVDVQNMFYAAKHLYNSKLNFARLLDYISRDRPLVRAIAYVVQTPEIDQSNFLAMLRSNSYEIRSKDLKQRPDGSAKGDWDMGLALDALAMADRLDVVAIVSGDGDFVDLVNFLKARGVRVEVYSFRIPRRKNCAIRPLSTTRWAPRWSSIRNRVPSMPMAQRATTPPATTVSAASCPPMSRASMPTPLRTV
jgi:uncharacterized LabA/DUF88 family protein